MKDHIKHALSQTLVHALRLTSPKLLMFWLTAIKKRVIKYCETVYEKCGKNLFWSIKHSDAIFIELKSRYFRATSLPPYDFPCFIQH